MNTHFNYSPSGDMLIVTIGNPMARRSKALYYVYALLFFMVGVLVFRLFTERDYNGLGTLFALGFMAAYFFVGRSYMRRVTQYEALFVTHSGITLRHRGFLLNRRQFMPLDRIGNIFVIDPPHETPSGLSFNNSFLPGQHEVELLTDKDKERIGIMTDGRQIRCGKGLTATDAAYVIKRIREFTGKTLTADRDIYDQLIRESSTNI
ncbi:SoxR reducing system RseC family protein [Chitinophaga sp. NPDC101104]|uniref:SoxR reducing system RseC family protein n=1 Tax=Chitinophaga sp. NPDC101104 TaxID=3390561 RepID=UPI003CFDEB22